MVARLKETLRFGTKDKKNHTDMKTLVDFVNEAVIKGKKVFAADGTECKALIKYCNKNGDLADGMAELLEAHNYVEEVEDPMQKMGTFKFQSTVSEKDLPNCKVLIYKTLKEASADVKEFIEKPAHKAGYSIRPDSIQATENPRQCDFLMVSDNPGKDLKN